MIGLFGLYHRDTDRPVDLSSMAASVPSRYAVEATSGHGAQVGRTTIRLDLGSDAFVSSDGNVKAVSMGEIFNAQDLWTGQGSITPREVAKLVTHLSKTGNLSRLAEANGLFCVAVYDSLNHRLTLITDRHASYPLHVWHDDDDVAFGGQILTLIGHDRVSRKADFLGIAQIFTTRRTAGRQTTLSGIEALPAACIWQVDRQGIKESTYWKLAWAPARFSKHEAASMIANALRNAVKRQTASESPGLLLSGGLDSRAVLAAAPRGSLPCWTTASYVDNPELSTARHVAAAFGAPHDSILVDPADTLDMLEPTVAESSGLYGASTSFSLFLSDIPDTCDAYLTGHAIDYTLRGMYLPARFLRFRSSNTRLPILSRLPKEPKGADVLRTLRHGLPRDFVTSTVAPKHRERWWREQEAHLDDLLQPWRHTGQPADAWDAYTVHAISKHYTFTGMMSCRARGLLRIPALDNDVFDLFLQLPAEWRVSGDVVKMALRLLSDEAADIPNANTKFRADTKAWPEVIGQIGNAVLQKLHLKKRLKAPGYGRSTGSWANVGELYRNDPAHRQRFSDIRARIDHLSLGILDVDACARHIDNHLNGYANNEKLLRQLLTHDVWVRSFGVEGSV